MNRFSIPVFAILFFVALVTEVTPNVTGEGSEFFRNITGEDSEFFRNITGEDSEFFQNITGEDSDVIPNITGEGSELTGNITGEISDATSNITGEDSELIRNVTGGDSDAIRNIIRHHFKVTPKITGEDSEHIRNITGEDSDVTPNTIIDSPEVIPNPNITGDDPEITSDSNASYPEVAETDDEPENNTTTAFPEDDTTGNPWHRFLNRLSKVLAKLGAARPKTNEVLERKKRADSRELQILDDICWDLLAEGGYRRYYAEIGKLYSEDTTENAYRMEGYWRIIWDCCEHKTGYNHCDEYDTDSFTYEYYITAAPTTKNSIMVSVGSAMLVITMFY